MKKNPLLLISCAFVFIINAKAQTTFQKEIGDQTITTAGYGGVIKTSDGGYALAGDCFQNTTSHNVYVVKLDDLSNFQWGRTIGDSTEQIGFGIIQTSDGGLAIAGRSNTVAGSLDLDNGYIVKLNSTGDLEWAKNIGGYEMDEFRSVVETPEGNLVVAGYSSTFCFGLGVSDVYVVAFNTAGNILWERNIGGSGIDMGMGIVCTADSGLVVAGYSGSFGQGNTDIYCVKLDKSGTLEWTTTIGGAQWDWGYAITNTTDGGFAIAGYTSSFGAGSNDMYLVKLDGNGVLQWTRTIGTAGDDRANSIIQDMNGDYILVGHSNSSMVSGDDIYLVKLDNAGSLLWTRIIDNGGDEKAWGVTTDVDGGYVINASSQPSSGSGKMYVLKIDVNGNSCGGYTTGGTVSSGGVASTGGTSGSGGHWITGATSDNIGTETNLCFSTGLNETGYVIGDFNLSPNPSAENVSILFSKPFTGSIEIINAMGEMVRRIRVSHEVKMEIGLSDIPTGVYFVKLFDGVNYSIRKFLVAR